MTGTYPSPDEMAPASQYNMINQPIFTVSDEPRAAEAAPLLAPPGAPTVGMWVEERYCGLITWVVCMLGNFPCAYICPCDRRTVWISGAVKYNDKGAVVDDKLCHNPCPPGCCNRNPTRR